MRSARGIEQLALDLPPVEGIGLSDFLRAPCNTAAYDCVLAWPAWPGPVLILHGPPGAGKTHLLRIWAARAGAVSLDPGSLWGPAEPLSRLGSDHVCAVDDADRVTDEVLLLHLHNRIVDGGGSLLLAGAGPARGWGVELADLRSRLLAAHAVAIERPDDALLAALLVKQLADRQLRVESTMIDYLLPRLERSFAAVRGLVAALDRASLRARRPITLPLARAVLEELTMEENPE